ncbi:MAG: hypothetical protein GX359_04450 [Clostridiales bacterium]|nr:hypothetical protein [Clostridiales bacterium]
MASNIVAYIGIDNFDNILYLARILSKLGKKVLVIDNSDSMSVLYSIPQPKGMNSLEEIITYRQVDFTRQEINQEMKEEYDDILIFYGFLEKEKDISECNRIVFVTDQYRYNYSRIPDMTCEKGDQCQIEQDLLIKDVAPMKITPEIIVERIGIPIRKENVSVLYHDERDYTNSLVCHYNGSFGLKGISKQRKAYLLEEVKKLHPDIDIHLSRTAFRRMRKGR